MKTNKILALALLSLSLVMSSCSGSYFGSKSVGELSKSDKVVHFEFDSAELSGKYKRQLKKKIIRWAKKNPNDNIVVEGYCDERGSYAYNKKLGNERAKAVKNYLVKYGIASSRIKTISYGESNPIAKGSNEEAWKLNRRAVTLTIAKRK